MNGTINWGILGTGHIAHTFAKDFAFTTHGKIVAVGSRNLQTARAFANSFSIPNAYGSYEALAAAPEIDIIYISTPHTFHHENALLCLNGGKSVLCEKPVTVNCSQLEEVLALAQRKGLFFMEALWTLCMPVVIQVKNWIARGSVGELRFIQASFGIRGNRTPESRLLNPALAGGALLDIGIYPVLLSNYMLGEVPELITADAVLGQTGVDEQCAILFRYRQNAMATLACSFHNYLGNEAVITGTEGQIRIKNFWKAQRAELIKDFKVIESATDHRQAHGFHYEIQEATNALLSGQLESALVPHAFSRQTMQCLDEVRRQIGLVYPFEKTGR